MRLYRLNGDQAFYIYIDDGHISAESKEQVQEALQTVYMTLAGTGFKLAVEKSDTRETVAQTKEYLVFQLMPSECRFSCQREK